MQEGDVRGVSANQIEDDLLIFEVMSSLVGERLVIVSRRQAVCSSDGES